MPVKLNSSGGGSVTLDVPVTASNFTLNLPATSGSVIAANSSGDVGIGTSSPTQKLEVAAATAVRIAATETGSAVTAQVAANTAEAIFGSFTNHPAVLRTNNTERARITTGGNFLVATTSTFDVTSGATTQLSGQCAVYNAGSPNTLMSFYNDTQSARVGFIGSNGNSTSYNSGSDYRLKENVVGIAGALDAVQSMRPVTFTWKYSPTSGVFSGFIAHELQEVWPEAVSGEKDAVCSDGETPDYQAVDQSKLVPLLVAAVQELKAENDALKARITALEAR